MESAIFQDSSVSICSKKRPAAREPFNDRPHFLRRLCPLRLPVHFGRTLQEADRQTVIRHIDRLQVELFVGNGPVHEGVRQIFKQAALSA